ncbi:MAG TPA: hypothetical protein VF730_06030, partial [Terracidiphilus sp.]
IDQFPDSHEVAGDADDAPSVFNAFTGEDITMQTASKSFEKLRGALHRMLCTNCIWSMSILTSQWACERIDRIPQP